MNLTLCFEDPPCKVVIVLKYFISLINIPLTMAGTGSSKQFIHVYIIKHSSLNITMDPHETCSICDRKPEDLLVLLCQHNLCVNCATQIYHLNNAANPFICQICLSETPLDPDTISHLQLNQEEKHTHQQDTKENSQRHQPPKPKSKKNKKYDNAYEYCIKDDKQPSYNISSNSNINCITHDEPAIYYCYDCQAADICSQCILTAKHANHNVSTFKKAAIFFYQKLQETVREKETLFQKLSNQKSQYLMSKRHILQQANTHKEQLKQIFDGLARAISDEYASNCAIIESESNNITQILDGCLAEIDDKLRILSETMETQRRMGENWKKGGNFKISQKIPNPHSLMIYMPRLPKELPMLNVTIRCSEQIQSQLSSILKQIVISSQKNLYPRHESYQINLQNQSIDEQSLIRQQDLISQAPRTVLKQSQMRGANRCSTHKMQSSRKMQLSRSLDNATNIINKLQERSRKVK